MKKSATPGFQAIVLGGLTVVSMGLFLTSLALGPADLSLAETAAALTTVFSGNGGDPLTATIVLEIRLPRALLGLLVGATLGLAGAALQGFLRNPLAEPGIIGASSAAALGAVISIHSGLAALFPLALPLSGIAGAGAAVVLLYLLSGRESSVLTLILAGVAVSSLAGALTSLVLNLAPNPFAVFDIVFWLLGSLADRSMTHVALAAPLIAIGWLLMFSGGRALDALTLGEDTARSLGINLAAARGWLIAGTALAVGAAVAVSGTIGFVGLVVPHMLRPLVGYSPSRLLPASALGGGALLLAADLISRGGGGSGYELKLGVVTALLGAPFFLFLVLSTRRRMR